MKFMKKISQILLIFLLLTIVSCTKTEIDNNYPIENTDGHVFDTGVIESFATSSSPAQVSFKCTKEGCTLTKTKNISLTSNHVHKYIFICINNSEYIKEEATCTSLAKYYKTCICGEHSTDTIIYGNYKEHEYNLKIENDKAFIESATCQHGTKYHYSCTCGSVSKDIYYELDDKLSHEYNLKIENENTLKDKATCMHGNIYYYSCKCGAISDKVTYELNDKLEHSYNQKVSTENSLMESATCMHGSRYYYSCECGEISDDLYYELNDKLEHSYTVKNIVSEALKDEATCTSKAVYYYSCSCGLISDSLTFEYGDIGGHTYNVKTSCNDTLIESATCTHGSKYYYSCACGSISDTLTYELDDKLDHTYNIKTISTDTLKTNATCSNKAIYYYSCTCGSISDTLTFEDGNYGNHTYVHYDLDENLTEHYECSACNKYFNLDKEEVTKNSLIDEELQAFYSYNKTINSLNLSTYIYTFSTGVGMNDINNYISDFDSTYIDEFEIQNGKLVYIGSTYTLKATKANIEIGEQLYLDDIALLTTAYAYYYQGNDIQYDMYTNRRSININPEAAADNNTIFLDCSSFVNSVYYNTYGKNILAGRKSSGVSDETPSTANFDTVATSATLSSRYGLVKYYDITKVTLGDTTTINSILTEAEGLLEVGDLINYRHGSAGHVMLYIGDNKFIHCTGSSYAVATGTKNFPNCVTNPFTIPDSATSYEKSNGAIQISDSSMLFSESGDRYLFKVDNNEFVNSNFCILRPENRTYSSGSKVFTSLTTDALNRLSIPNVEMEKTSSVYNFKTVNTGDKITYTITLKNNNSYPINYVTINDTLSENVILDSWDRPYILDETTNVITFKNIVINANSTYQISYTVKVKSNLNPGTLIESNGYVNGIKLNTIINIVSGLSDSELTNLENTLKTKNIGSATNELDYINSLYDEQIFNTTSLSTVFEDLYKYDTETSLYSINESSVYYKYLVKTLYNGLSMKTDEYNFNINDRTRLLQYKYLEAGDIILTCTPATSSSTPTYIYTMYIYVNSNLILKVDGTTITTFTSSLGSSNSTTDKFDGTTYQFLERLTGCHRYMVLRPSIGL